MNNSCAPRNAIGLENARLFANTQHTGPSTQGLGSTSGTASQSTNSTTPTIASTTSSSHLGMTTPYTFSQST